jgi:hypothetical protein
MANAPGLHFQPQLLAKLDASLVRQNGTSAERDPRPEVVQWVHCKGSQFRSAVLDLFRPLWHLACLCHVAGSNEVLRRTYGKDNRVLHTAKLSQGFKVVSPSRTWQGAGISTGGTTIGVTAPETGMAKLVQVPGSMW